MTLKQKKDHKQLPQGGKLDEQDWEKKRHSSKQSAILRVIEAQHNDKYYLKEEDNGRE